MSIVTLPTRYYQQFDADRSRDVPAEGYGGWQEADLPLDLDRTAVVVMHAWDCGTWDQHPGWFRAVEYLPRSYDIVDHVFPELLAAVRASKLKLFHVVKPNSHYYREEPGYKRAEKLAEEARAGTAPVAAERIEQDSVHRSLLQFRSGNIFPGTHNQPDIAVGNTRLDFPEAARPLGDEGIAENGDQLFALCKEAGVSHLIYVGFAINGCLLTSPGGMFDMQPRGMLCSTVPEAVTAIENKETARGEHAKQLALWYVALLYGFVYEKEALIRAIRSEG